MHSRQNNTNISDDIPIVEDSNNYILNSDIRCLEYFSQCITDICNKDNIDISNITPMNWTYIMMMLNLYYIRPNKNLTTTNNKLDTNKIWFLYKVYKNLCVKYNKYIRLCDFCYLLEIDEVMMMDGGNRELTRLYIDLTKSNEESLESALVGGKINSMNILPVLNYRHKWSATELKDKLVVQQAITSESLPNLSLTDEQKRLK